MIPIEFKGQNVVFAKDQPEYIPLPAHRDSEGVVTTCWKFSFKERLRVLLGAKLYWQHLTFNQPLQPVKPIVGDCPL